MSDVAAPAKPRTPLATWVAIIMACLAIAGAGSGWIWNYAFLRADVNVLQTGQASRASKDDIIALQASIATRASADAVMGFRETYARYVIDTRRELDEMKAAGWSDKISDIKAALARIETDLRHLSQRQGSTTPDRPTAAPPAAASQQR